MAKGDPSRVQNAIDYNYGTAGNYLGDLTQRNNQFYDPALQQYQGAVGTNLNDYNSVMNAYRQFLGMQQQPMGGMQAQSGQQGGQQGDPEGFRQAWFASGGKTVDDLKNFVSQHPEYGATITGSKGSKLTFPGGQAFQAVRSAGLGGGVGPAWDDLSGGGAGGGPGQNFDFGALGPALAGYLNFAQTGGFSPQDIQNIRGRANAPIKATYQNMMDDLNRSKALSGGHLTNFGATAAKLAREKSYAMGDQSLNTEGMLSQLINQGKQFGISGAGNIGMGLRGQGLQGMSGMGNLYGTTPGLVNTFGNQVLSSGAQGLDIAQLQNQLANSRVQAQIARAQLPNRWDTAKTAIGDITGIGGLIGGFASPFFGSGSALPGATKGPF